MKRISSTDKKGIRCWNEKVLFFENVKRRKENYFDQPLISCLIASAATAGKFNFIGLFLHRKICLSYVCMSNGFGNESFYLDMPEAALERVPWVPVNPSIFQIIKKKAYDLVKRSKKSLNQRLLSRCEPVDWNS